MIGQNKTQEKEGSYKGMNYTYFDSGNYSSPIVLVGHGMGKNRDSNTSRTLAKKLLENKVSSLCLDCQDNDKVLPVSGVVDKYCTMGDLAKSEGYEGTNIFGTSLTGLPAVISASELAAESLCLKSPLLYFADMVKRKIGNEGLKKWQEAGYIKKNGSKLPWELYDEWSKLDMKEITGKLGENPTRVKIIQGNQDEMVPLSYTQKFYDLLTKEGVDSDLQVINGADHSYTNMEHFAQMINSAIEFLTQKTSKEC